MIVCLVLHHHCQGSFRINETLDKWRTLSSQTSLTLASDICRELSSQLQLLVNGERFILLLLSIKQDVQTKESGRDDGREPAQEGTVFSGRWWRFWNTFNLSWSWPHIFSQRTSLKRCNLVSCIILHVMYCTVNCIFDVNWHWFAQRTGDVGIIESITLKNFMCHAHLGPFAFGPNVNFVVGNNGSKWDLFSTLYSLTFFLIFFFMCDCLFVPF